jgi:Ca-activated chloride channel family protein
MSGPRALHVRADRRLIHAGRSSRRYLRLEVVAPAPASRTPLNLALVLDRSGSMSGDKLNLARAGAIRAVRSLARDDRLSVVVYDERVAVLLPSEPADDRTKGHAESLLHRVGAGGNTDLCAGWLRGCEQAGLALDGRRLARCLLLTDGLANSGITDRATIVQHAAELRKRGVTTSTLGVGRDFDEVLLRQMAETGGGNFYFAEDAAQIADFIAGETGEALRVVAREAQLLVEVPPGASLTSPNPFPWRLEPGRVVFALGSLVAEQVLGLVICVEIPPGREGGTAVVRCRLRDADGALGGSTADATFTYASAVANASEARNADVDREVALAYAAWARKRAAELGRLGKVAEGRAVLTDTAAPIRNLAGHDPELVLLASALEAEAVKLGNMNSLDYKRFEYSSYGLLSSRDDDGMASSTVSFTARALAGATLRPPARVAAHAPFYVVAVTPDEEATRLVEAAGRALAARSRGAFDSTVVDSGTRFFDPGPGEVLSLDDERKLASALTTSAEGGKVAFVHAGLEGGVASHWYATERAAVVSLGGGDEKALPPVAFVAYQLALNGARSCQPAWDPTAARRCDAPGCWSALGGSRAEIEARIATGDLCPDCRGLYAAAGIDLEAVLGMVATVRELAQRPAPVAVGPDGAASGP